MNKQEKGQQHKESEFTADELAGNGAEPNQDLEQEDQSSPKSRIRRILLLSILGILVLAGGVYGWNWYQFAKAHESTDNAQIEGNISPIIPRVDGYVQQIYVDDNELVEKGALLVSIDKSNYELGVKQAEASLAGAKAALENARARLSAARAEVDRTDVALRQARSEKERQARLLEEGSTTQQHYDNAAFALESAQAQLGVARQQVHVTEVKLQQEQANIEREQSALEDANLQLSYTALRAPIAGRVSQKNVEQGQYLRPGQPVMAIANDQNVWVVANFKEGQIALIKENQPVDIEVDAYPDHVFKGKVQSLGAATGSKFALLPPDNASGNFVKVEQRIPVKIVFTDPQDPDMPLKPGMNVVPTVQVRN